MKDREQIIIDGVNVGECKHYERHSFYDCNETCEDNGAIVCTNCEDNPDCYFKQLARKTQECEGLKDFARRAENQREIYYKEFLRTNSALEEIKKVCLEDTYTFTDGTQIRYDSLDDILDIINKAKGEEQ